MLEYILSKRENQEIKKRAFIAYTVNKSAIKVGAGNVNSNDAFINDEPLGTITMRTRYGGVQKGAARLAALLHGENGETERVARQKR